VTPLLGPLTGLTRLTIQGAWSADSKPKITEALPLQHLKHLDLSHCHAHFANVVLPMAPQSLRRLNLHGLLLATAETAAYVARLTDLRVLSLEAIKTQEQNRFIDAMPTPRQLQHVNVSDWHTQAGHFPIAVLRGNLSELRHLDTWTSQNQGDDTDPVAVQSGEVPSPWLARLSVVDNSGFQAEARKLLAQYTVPTLTQLYTANWQLFGIVPTLAGALMASKIGECAGVRRLSLAGFLACSEAALQVAAAATGLTFLDLSS
jgi:hypothetical protein